MWAIWSDGTRAHLERSVSLNASIMSVAVSGPHLLVAAGCHAIRRLDCQTLKSVDTNIRHHEEGSKPVTIMDVVIDLPRALIYSSGNDGSVILWQIIERPSLLAPLRRRYVKAYQSTKLHIDYLIFLNCCSSFLRV
jgi:hypothetical protein